MEFRNFAISILVLLSFASCSQKNIAGYYTSNVAELGFFVTRIKLNDDSTFSYEFGGDLSHDNGKGKYNTDKEGVVYLNFEPEPEPSSDSLELIAIALSGNKNRPEKFKYQNGRLYSFHIDGHVVKKGQAYSRRRKYLFFGERYMTIRKIYLKKRTDRKLDL